jgi:hypothetical protein
MHTCCRTDVGSEVVMRATDGDVRVVAEVPASSITTPRRISLLVDQAEFEAWLEKALPGDTLEYHRGFLPLDRLPPGSRLGQQNAIQLDRVAADAMALAGAGRVHLVQRRHGCGDYSYIAVAAAGRRPFDCRPAGKLAL